jgi:hypothetical protein
VCIARGGGEETQVVDGKRHIAAQAEERVRLAGVLRFKARELFGARFDQISQFPKNT